MLCELQMCCLVGVGELQMCYFETLGKLVSQRNDISEIGTGCEWRSSPDCKIFKGSSLIDPHLHIPLLTVDDGSGSWKPPEVRRGAALHANPEVLLNVLESRASLSCAACRGRREGEWTRKWEGLASKHYFVHKADRRRVSFYSIYTGQHAKPSQFL